jgi:tRNA dimethylallyltransferase
MVSKPKLIVICGPTATGKSDLGVILAHAFNGEIISADSRQIYNGLDIGSGKITEEEMQNVPHHLLDVINPGEEFSVAKYKELADKAIFGIIGHSKLPILVGGTGYYIESVVDDIAPPEVSPNELLRVKLEQLNTEQLFEYLQNIDPVYAEKIDKDNPRRLIRAIEIVKALGKMPDVVKNERFEILMIGLDLPDEELKEKIKIRTEKRLQDGMIDEIKQLNKDGYSYETLSSLGFDQRIVVDYIENKINTDELKEQLINANWHYAKRQRTWFKRDTRIKWFHPNQIEEIEKEMRNFLRIEG